MNLFRLAPFFLVAASASVALAQQTPATFPYEPTEMLAALPDAPADWTIKRSEADTTLGDWLETRATRVFQAPPVPSNATSTPAAPQVGEIEISVTDTAGFTPSLAAFANFAPAKSGNVERKFIGSLPAVVVTRGEDGQLAQVLVSGRYIVEITLKHLAQPRIEDWLKSFHFDRLPSKSPTPATRPQEFRLTHLDELHPENNRSYSVSTTNSKRVSDFLKSLPPDPVDTTAR